MTSWKVQAAVFPHLTLRKEISNEITFSSKLTGKTCSPPAQSRKEK
jgi:hypothetical protein